MSAMASQITGVSIIYSTVCSVADQWKHQSSALLGFVGGGGGGGGGNLPVMTSSCAMENLATYDKF